MLWNQTAKFDGKRLIGDEGKLDCFFLAANALGVWKKTKLQGKKSTEKFAKTPNRHAEYWRER